MTTDRPDTFVTRFAPSPTGRLHKGHAYSALLAYARAREENGRFLLRIEDIDTVRCREDYIEGIYEDLAWLGLTWETPVRRQSEHFADYEAALDRLKAMGVIYPCFCTRKEIAAEIARAPSAPHGPDGALYPGTCRHRSADEREALMASGKAYAWRLDLAAALTHIGEPLTWKDELKGTVTAEPETLGDIVLARKDTPTSYHLSVVTDDALQGISHIIRGEDLFHATHIHVVLQRLLGLKTPIYHHHGLLLDEHGQRFAKRNLSVTLADMRMHGMTPEDLKAQLLSA
ncbi:tRNA glutamyl-Q(34) synthetase GluQRS [Kordiimonas marina]|uniref:tRNA glutamyl-Q(34) synthetase GluQRS n=1 Tax=Kordiimonas marina TaxID=2872312 RepID=UPI001FF398BB|nr:tRNA glutamyl-Q(34) synthetase GluQRS [Kordiimonas marina]MCJ9428424.1 tRNA glutamyl-Q(34) synthetase GluQRS [Kordiimonas marina]